MSDSFPRAQGCVGYSARSLCDAPPRYLIGEGATERRTCGRHLSWLIAILLDGGLEAVTVRLASGARP